MEKVIPLVLIILILMLILILLSWDCTAKFNLTRLPLIFRWKNIKSNLKLRRPDYFLSLFTAKHQEQSNVFKLVARWYLQACALFNCFKQAFSCIANIFILTAKKNTLKATETEIFFVHNLPLTQIHSHQFDAATLLKINLWRSLR